MGEIDSAAKFRSTYRRMWREGAPWRAIKAQFEPIMGRPPEHGEAEQMVTLAWKEARKLAGWTHEHGSQRWLRADGAVAREKDDHEWRGL